MNIFRMVRRVRDVLKGSVLAWLRRRRDRRVLVSLNERELRDLGIDRTMIDNNSDVEFRRWP